MKRLDATHIYNASIAIDLIDDHPDNPQEHSDTQIAQLSVSHETFGQYRSIVVWKRPNGRYTRVTGHGYSRGALLSGSHEMRCEVLPEDTDPLTIKAILVADNQHAKNGHTDENALDILLREQHNAGYDLATMGAYNNIFDHMSINSAQSFQAIVDEQIKNTKKDDSRYFEPVEALAKSPAQELETYLHGTIRQIILLYSPEKYTKIIDLFTTLRAQHPEIESNTDCVTYLLEQYFETTL